MRRGDAGPPDGGRPRSEGEAGKSLHCQPGAWQDCGQRNKMMFLNFKITEVAQDCRTEGQISVECQKS